MREIERNIVWTDPKELSGLKLLRPQLNCLKNWDICEFQRCRGLKILNVFRQSSPMLRRQYLHRIATDVARRFGEHKKKKAGPIPLRTGRKDNS